MAIVYLMDGETELIFYDIEKAEEYVNEHYERIDCMIVDHDWKGEI